MCSAVLLLYRNITRIQLVGKQLSPVPYYKETHHRQIALITADWLRLITTYLVTNTSRKAVVHPNYLQLVTKQKNYFSQRDWHPSFNLLWLSHQRVHLVPEDNQPVKNENEKQTVILKVDRINNIQKVTKKIKIGKLRRLIKRIKSMRK